MPDTIELETAAERLVAACYHNPDKIAQVDACAPVFPGRGAQRMWDAMVEAHEAGDLDTAKVEAYLDIELNGQDSYAQVDHRPEVNLLRRVRNHDVLGPVESASYGHKGKQLERWANRLADQSRKNQLATRLGVLANRVRETDQDMDTITAGLMAEIQDATKDSQRHGLQHVSEIVDEAIEDTYEWEEGIVNDILPTGFYSLDRAIEGLPVGELTIFAAPSGAGKTSFLLQLLRQVALIERGKDDPRAVAFFNIEMTSKQCLHRAAAAWKQINLRTARQRPEAQAESDTTHAEEHRSALESLRDLPLYIDDDPEPTLDQIRSRSMQIAARHDLALIGVDYDEKVNERRRSEEQRVAAISKGLKVTGKELNAACVALSQYNSAPSNEVRPGTDDDLRYSRKKKHEAHTIMHWYWPYYWIDAGKIDLETDDPPKGYDPQNERRGWIYVTKNRSGPRGRVALDFVPEHTRFVDPNEPDEGRTQDPPF